MWHLSTFQIGPVEAAGLASDPALLTGSMGSRNLTDQAVCPGCHGLISRHQTSHQNGHGGCFHFAMMVLPK